jgi:tetratricopeptide (TPR) repeat protein
MAERTGASLMAGDEGDRSGLEKPALSLEDLHPVPTESKEPAALPASAAVEVTAERPAFQRHRAAPPESGLMTHIDPETRTRLFLQGEINLAELYALSHEELYEIAAQGQRFIDSQRHEDAEKLFEGLTALDPYNADFHAGLGAIKQLKKDKESAMIEYDRAIQLNEGHVAARTNRAELYVEMGEYARALEDLRIVATVDPDGNDTHSGRARGLTKAVMRLLKGRLEDEQG